MFYVQLIYALHIIRKRCSWYFFLPSTIRSKAPKFIVSLLLLSVRYGADSMEHCILLTQNDIYLQTSSCRHFPNSAIWFLKTHSATTPSDKFELKLATASHSQRPSHLISALAMSMTGQHFLLSLSLPLIYSNVIAFRFPFSRSPSIHLSASHIA